MIYQTHGKLTYEGSEIVAKEVRNNLWEWRVAVCINRHTRGSSLRMSNLSDQGEQEREKLKTIESIKGKK